jgi:hypothetical protein
LSTKKSNDHSKYVIPKITVTLSNTTNKIN